MGVLKDWEERCPTVRARDRGGTGGTATSEVEATPTAAVSRLKSKGSKTGALRIPRTGCLSTALASENGLLLLELPGGISVSLRGFGCTSSMSRSD